MIILEKDQPHALGKTHRNVQVGIALKADYWEFAISRMEFNPPNFESEYLLARAFHQNSSKNGQLAFVEISLCVASRFSSQIRHPRLEIR